MSDVRVAGSSAEREDAFAVRQAVFVDEQGIDETLEYDGHDHDAVHFVAYDGDEPIGAARLRERDGGLGKLERVAVLPSRRGEGTGRELVRAAEEWSREAGLKALTLHAQTHAATFYRELGYDRRGEPFEEAGSEHVEMRKRFG